MKIVLEIPLITLYMLHFNSLSVFLTLSLTHCKVGFTCLLYFTMRITTFIIEEIYIFRQYKPLFKELTVWPELKLSNPPGISPFADPKQSKSHKTVKGSSPQRDNFKERYDELFHSFFFADFDINCSYSQIHPALQQIPTHSTLELCL